MDDLNLVNFQATEVIRARCLGVFVLGDYCCSRVYCEVSFFNEVLLPSENCCSDFLCKKQYTVIARCLFFRTVRAVMVLIGLCRRVFVRLYVCIELQEDAYIFFFGIRRVIRP